MEHATNYKGLLKEGIKYSQNDIVKVDESTKHLMKGFTGTFMKDADTWQMLSFGAGKTSSAEEIAEWKNNLIKAREERLEIQRLTFGTN